MAHKWKLRVLGEKAFLEVDVMGILFKTYFWFIAVIADMLINEKSLIDFKD